MSRKAARRLVCLMSALALGLAASACRTCGNAEPLPVLQADALVAKMRGIIIPEMTFYSPATIVDAVDFLARASRDYDKPGTPPDRRGITFELIPPSGCTESGGSTNVPMIPALSVRQVSLYDALKIVCKVTGMKLSIWGDGNRPQVRVTPPGYELGEDFTRDTYNTPELARRLSDTPAGSGDDPDQVWHMFFEQLGVTVPDRARFTYLPTIGKLSVVNTRENLAVIQQVFDAFAPRMIEVEAQVHAFRRADIERLRLSDGGVSAETLMALRRRGKSRPVASASGLTKPGLELVVKAVREVLYPTELGTDTDLTDATSNVTARSAAGALLPCNFETRETGLTLRVVPEAGQGDTRIHLSSVNARWIAQDGWDAHPADMVVARTHKTFPFRPPVFGETDFQTRGWVDDGETVLIGSCSTPDGEWVQVGFLTARLRAVEAEPSERERRSKRRRDPSVASVKQKMHEIVIPEMTFRPPATVIDAVKFFAQASRDFDKPEIPVARRGIDFVLKLPQDWRVQKTDEESSDPSAVQSTNAAPVIAMCSARFIDLYDAVKLVCDITDMKILIREGVVWIVPYNEPEDDLVTRIYPELSSGVYEAMRSAGKHRQTGECLGAPPLPEGTPVADAAKDDGSLAQTDWKFFFTQMGMSWPEGSSIRDLPLVGKVRITNTPENLELFDQILCDLADLPRRVETDVQIHAFRPADIERLRLSGEGVSVEALTALRREGKSKPVASASAWTESRHEVIVKAVRGTIFPTELSMDGSQAGNVTPGTATAVLMPCNFELREVGMILQVVPEVMSGTLIDVLLNPQWTTLDRWESHPADVSAEGVHRRLSLRQPVFGVTSFQTQVTVENGGTVLLGSSTTPDGEWVHVGFLTVRLADVQSGLAEGRRQ